MNHQKSELYFLFFLLTGIFILAFFIFKPFIYALIFALVFATIFDSVNEYILAFTHGKRGVSAFLSTLFIFVVVLIPAMFLCIQIFHEATGLYSLIAQNGSVFDFSRGVIGEIEKLNRFIPASVEYSIDVSEYFRQGLGWLLQNLGPLFSNVAKIMLDTFVFLVALYCLFKDGHKLKATVISLSPLRDTLDETIFAKLGLAINSVIKGGLLVALIQGILTTIGFAFFGVPNAVLWGSVATVAALIPGIGTALVLIPGIIYLYFSGEVAFALALLVWGMIAVGLIDNFLGPKLVGRGTKLHSFLILLSILGGIVFFGPIGFLLGPLVLSLLFVLIEIYFTINKEYKC